MMNAALLFGFAAITVSLLLTLWRLIKGPDLPDRIMAVDTLYVEGIGLLVLVGMWLRNSIYFEAALLIAMMGFVGTVAWCKHLLRGNIID